MVLPVIGFSEPVSSWLHLGGAALALTAAPALWRHGRLHGRHGMVSLAVYSFSVVFLLSMSGVYHLLTPGTASRAVFHRLDHAAIWVLIAGTFTAVHFAAEHPGRRLYGVSAVWLLAIAGLVIKTVYFRDFPTWLGVVLYVILGWLVGIIAFLLFRGGKPLPRKSLLVAGGVVYSLGAAVGSFDEPMLIPGWFGPHELFHVAVLLGALLHWRFVAAVALEMGDRTR